MHLLRSLALALTVTASLAACGGGSKAAPAEPAPAPEAAPMNEAPPEAPEVAEEPAPAEWTGSTSLPSCDEYIALMDAYLTCDKIPEETRVAARQGMDAMKQHWGGISDLPPDVQQQMSDACTTANEALRQGATALGCPL
jgi:hypothetical protein